MKQDLVTCHKLLNHPFAANVSYSVGLSQSGDHLVSKFLFTSDSWAVTHILCHAARLSNSQLCGPRQIIHTS